MSGVVLWAAGGDLFTIGVMIVFIIIPLIGVVASKLREIGQPTNQVRPARPDTGRIQEQIDEFLRRAAQRRGVPAPVEQPQAVEPVVEEETPVGGRVNQEVQTFLDTSEFRRRGEELGGDVVQSDERFAKQVGQAFSGEVGRLASRPGETAQPADVLEMEAGGPEYLSRPTLDALPLAGSGLADLLGSPENIAQAVIMSEILRRPEW
jgi:hypothetical protein